MHSTPPLGGSCQNIVIRFDTEKLELWVCRWWKKFENMFTHFDRIHERDRQTDRRHRPRLCIASRQKSWFSNISSVTAGPSRVVNIWTVQYRLYHVSIFSLALQTNAAEPRISESCLWQMMLTKMDLSPDDKHVSTIVSYAEKYSKMQHIFPIVDSLLGRGYRPVPCIFRKLPSRQCCCFLLFVLLFDGIKMCIIDT